MLGIGRDPRKKGHWTAEEDRRLIHMVRLYGEGQWNKLARAAGLPRCGKSCRLRWVNYLRPGVKRGQITEDEERLIIQMHGIYGRRWSLIAAHLPGRSDNEIKNYWRSHIKKKLKGNKDFYIFHGSPAVVVQEDDGDNEEDDGRSKYKKKDELATFDEDLTSTITTTTTNTTAAIAPVSGASSSCLEEDNKMGSPAHSRSASPSPSPSSSPPCSSSYQVLLPDCNGMIRASDWPPFLLDSPDDLSWDIESSQEIACPDADCDHFWSSDLF